MAVTKTRFTFADLLELPPEDHGWYEIVGGELVVLAAPDEPHAAVVIELVLFLGEAQRAGYGRVQTAPRAVALDWAERGMGSQDVPQPDVLFVAEANRPILSRAVEGPPDLVVEVLSPSTRGNDLPGGRKFLLYERYGVPHYWTVDTDARTISQYTWADGYYGAPRVLRPGDQLASPLFPGITCDVAQIFSAFD